MPNRKLMEFLDQQKIKYVVIRHSMAFTALEIAKSAHVPMKDMAKTIIVKINGQHAMVVLPANYRIDIDALREAFQTDDVVLANELEFSTLFPDCEIGAMPPFGNLYGMDVYVEEPLSEREQIAFNAGSHSETIKMPYKDYEQLVKPACIILA